MSFPGTAPDSQGVCPHLGLADDNDSHATYPTDAHRCYALANPTRIATNHQERFCLGADHPACPVYQGQGVEATQTPPAGAVPPVQPSGAEPVAQPPQWTEQAPEQPAAGAFGGGGRPAGRPPQAPRRPPTGSVGGERTGISMSMATIGLFAIAIVVVVVAFFINQQLGDDDDTPLSADQQFQTQQAQTQQAGGGTFETPTPGGDGTDPTPGGEPTEPTDPGTDPTEPTDPGPDPTEPANGGGGTHVVQAGDLCGTIAEQYDITLQELLDANGMVEDDCLTLFVDQELIIP